MQILGYTCNKVLAYTAIVAGSVDSQNHPEVAVAGVRYTTVSSSPPCGKICSYEWDTAENGKYYPLLYKVVNCSNILYRMAYPPYPPVTGLPPRRPPSHLLQQFTVDQKCPITFHWYFNDDKKLIQENVTAEQFRRFLERDKVANINSYRDKNVLKPALVKYVHTIRGKRVAVIGTVKPWAEAMLLNLGASNVTTVEYRKLLIEDARVTTTTPYRLAKQFIGGYSVSFDTVFTYSSLEHTGLGRYGDPITPFGDLEAAAQVWCMVKPGGHFILAVGYQCLIIESYVQCCGTHIASMELCVYST